jgi:hypothetical protein
MSHWAEIDKDNKVIRVTVGNNEESDEGYSWLVDNLGGNWIKTSYNAKIRGNFAAKGFTYFLVEDIFMPVQCHTEAVLDAKAAKWDCTNSDHDVKLIDE